MSDSPPAGGASGNTKPEGSASPPRASSTVPSSQRTQLTIRQAQLVARKLVLEARGTNGTTGVLGELADARNTADLEVVDGFLAQVEAHKLTLPA